ncbi:MAG TPA: PAC2 family protein, partial [Terrimesophilobacter sp.]|nr:PAC2 family protein [Terrimesophilobacter sp.]
MANPEDLYTVNGDIVDVPRGLALVAGFTGFADAGSAVSGFTEALLDTVNHEMLATFDNDALYDYRARRPMMHFDQDHLVDYSPPSLALHLAQDDMGRDFLLLVGYEPDFRWEQFTAAILDIVERFEVSTTTWVHAIPMPVPHTRPIGMTVSGNRAELIDSYSVWRPTTGVPANVLHLVEYRLQEIDHPVAGFVLLIPHYLADTEFPDAAVKSLEAISAATGLLFATDALRETGREFIAKIGGQVAGNTELARLVGTLEERYDSYMEGNP